MYHLKIRELRYKITLIQNYRKKYEIRPQPDYRKNTAHTLRHEPSTKNDKKNKGKS